MKLPGWFRTPNMNDVVAFDYDGRTWVSDGRVMMVGEPPADARRINPGNFGMSLVPADAASESARKNGFVVLGGVVFCEHYVNLCAEHHPDLVWHLSADSFTAIGIVDGRQVAVVAMNRSDIDKDDGRPKCAECGGGGKQDCSECYGCGLDADDDDCATCDGSGEDGECPTCGGDGLWKEPAPVAAE